MYDEQPYGQRDNEKRLYQLLEVLCGGDVYTADDVSGELVDMRERGVSNPQREVVDLFLAGLEHIVDGDYRRAHK